VLNGTGTDGNGALQALTYELRQCAAIGGIVAASDSTVRVTRDSSGLRHSHASRFAMRWRAAET
jgi:hypothetical protein